MPILSSYKTGYHLNGVVSPSVKGKMWKANGAKINILQQSCYLFYDLGDFCTFYRSVWQSSVKNGLYSQTRMRTDTYLLAPLIFLPQV